MNYIQFCYHLFPTKIFKEDREEYILSLRQCQDEGSQLNDTGILPDIEVKSDFIDFLRGKDNQLNMAIDIITTKVVNLK